MNPEIKKIVDALNGMNGDDPDFDHLNCDDLLLKALSLAGFQEVVDAYEKTRERIDFLYD